MVAVIEVALTVSTVAGRPPIVTVTLLTKPVPVMVTEVPPAVTPRFGVILVTVGAGALVVNETSLP